MSTCKYCIHAEKCRDYLAYKLDKALDGINGSEKPICEFFKDRSKFIELPCKVGEQLYRVKNLGKGTVTTTSLNENTFWRIVMQGEFGKTVFLTKEEAERVKKEKKQ